MSYSTDKKLSGFETLDYSKKINDTIRINDSITLVYSYEKGVIREMTTVKNNYKIQRISFHDNSILQIYHLAIYSPEKGIKYDSLGEGTFHYYSQRLALDSLGNAEYYRLTNNFNIVAISKE